MDLNNQKPESPDERPQPIFFARKEFDGTNSEIREHHYPDGKRLVVTRLGARKGGFSFEEAHEIVEAAKRYHDELIALGVPVPEIEQLYVEYEPTLDRSIVVKASPWAGHEIKKIILESDHTTEKDRILEYAHTIVAITKPILKQRHKGYELSTGIDAGASNYIRDDKGNVCYVDLFPTRIRKEDGEPIVEWPHPQTELGKSLGHFKHFDIRGIMLSMSSQLARLKPELKEHFEDVVFQGFKDALETEEYEAFHKELALTPWIKLRSELKNNKKSDLCLTCIETSLEERPFGIDYSIYTLRELALELASKGFMSKDELEQFFKDSHFEDELPKEDVEKLKIRLVEILQK